MTSSIPQPYIARKPLYTRILSCCRIPKRSNKSLTLAWDSNPISDRVTGYRVYELVKPRRVLIWQSKATHLVHCTGQRKHVYVVTALSAKRESVPSAPLQVQN